MHQLNSIKRARVTSNAIHLPCSRILHYVRFRYPIYQKLATQQQVSERISLLLLVRQYKRSVSKASQRTFKLSTGVLFASNDSKTSFEQRKNWPITDN
jgi:hypothetical protein